MTYMQAALTILTHAEYPLTIGELTAVAIADGLIRPRGRTPDRTMSSVLYRRMAVDPDAPIISRGGRFWLRGRPLPQEQGAYLAQRARRAQSSGRRAMPGARRSASRQATILPPPPLHVPAEALAGGAAAPTGSATFAATRRERAIARAGERGSTLLARLQARRADGAEWDAAQTATRLIAPLLAHLGYRRGKEIAPIAHAGRGAVGYVLHVDDAPAIALLVRRLGHDLHDDDVWRALSHARQADAPYAAATNGRELRLYALAMAEAHDNPAAAQVVALDLGGRPDGAASAALWLLSREAVATGALDAYAADRAVGAALLEALDAPDSPLARALVADVRSRTGLALPSETVLRHARLVVRGRRGRDGEPAPEDVAAVSGVQAPRLAQPVLPIVTVARSA